MTSTDKKILSGAAIIGIILALYLKSKAGTGQLGNYFPVPNQLNAPSTNVPWWVTYNNQPTYQGVVPDLPLQLPQLNVPVSTGGSTCAACNWWNS